MIRQICVSLVFAAIAQAHFLLNYPPSRGFVEANEVEFCGGFNTPSANRTHFPLSGGIVTITSEHPMADILIGLSTLENPTTFAEFNHTANGTTYPFLTPFTVMHAQGDACFPVNASALGISEVHNGADATIMVQFDGPDGVLFQCADIILDTNATILTSVKCDNATGAFPTSTSTSTSSGNSTGSSNGNMATSLVAFSYANTLVAGFIITGALVLL